MTEYNVYFFKGVYNKYRSGKIRRTDLSSCLEHTFCGYGKSMKDFFNSSYFAFDVRQMTVKDVFKAIENKAVFIPFAAFVSKREVEEYLKAGFSVAFMKAAEYRKMQKEYKDYI